MGHPLRDSVTHYIDHLEDATWVESLVGQYGLGQVLQSCIDVLTEQNPAHVHQVTTLLLDVGRTGVMMTDDFVAEVRALMPAGVLPGLRSLLRAPALSVRMNAINTIGRLSFAEEAEALRDAFPSYLDRDPLCLPRLLFELRWLGDRRGVNARVKRTIGHKHYLVRWSALGYLNSGSLPSRPAERELRLRSAWLRTLSRDSAPRVAAEARHQLAELEMEIAGRQAAWWPKAEWRNKRCALEKARPPMTFSLLESRFVNDMAQRKQADYTIEELDTFVRGL